jgi:hypothetical protein
LFHSFSDYVEASASPDADHRSFDLEERLALAS